MIVLLTDFGQSEYVGVMKGVILSLQQDARIVDLSHSIWPQNIMEASWILKNNYQYFPQGSVFCCVVDPGVGTERKALAVKTQSYYFIAPDNGLLWETIKQQKVLDIRQIPIPAGASRTFHARDIFAKAAANIHKGNFDSIGEKMDTIEKMEFFRSGRTGTVVRIDRFGNIITNLDKLDHDHYIVVVNEKTYRLRYYPNYDSAKEGELFLIEGSSSTLEISLKNDSAQEKLNLKIGQRITIS